MQQQEEQPTQIWQAPELIELGEVGSKTKANASGPYDDGGTSYATAS
ncbi:hypothetical protein ABHF91_00580 [Pseudaeromonas sp. ZJS20]